MSKRFDKYSDQELLALFHKSQNQKWLGVLLERYTLLLLGVCIKYLKDRSEAEDAVQQVFLKCLSAIPKTQIDNFGGWIYRVAKNECFSKLREKNNIQWTDVFEKNIEDEEEKDWWEEEKRFDNMEAALSHLKEEQRQCITLFYLEGKSYVEISEQSGYSLKQVKSYIQNGKRNLKILMDSDLLNLNSNDKNEQ